MDKYRLMRKTVEALADIWNYTLDEWSGWQVDDYYNMQIVSSQKVVNNPKLLGKRYDEILDGLCAKHLLFYRILDDGDVEIIRIFHERMDLQNRMHE